jgi:alpha-D-xyloside xylohydrolase
MNFAFSGFKKAPQVFVNGPDYGKTVLRSMQGLLIDYYFTHGRAARNDGEPQPSKLDGAIAGYRAITGTAPLYGKWAYGFWQCKEHYKTQTEVTNAALGYRQRNIPVDNIVQDWHYWGNLGWGPQWDPAFYPDPAGMVKNLSTMDVHLMVSHGATFEIFNCERRVSDE